MAPAATPAAPAAAWAEVRAPWCARSLPAPVAPPAPPAPEPPTPWRASWPWEPWASHKTTVTVVVFIHSFIILWYSLTLIIMANGLKKIISISTWIDLLDTFKIMKTNTPVNKQAKFEYTDELTHRQTHEQTNKQGTKKVKNTTSWLQMGSRTNFSFWLNLYNFFLVCLNFKLCIFFCT